MDVLRHGSSLNAIISSHMTYRNLTNIDLGVFECELRKTKTFIDAPEMVDTYISQLSDDVAGILNRLHLDKNYYKFCKTDYEVDDSGC